MADSQDPFEDVMIEKDLMDEGPHTANKGVLPSFNIAERVAGVDIVDAIANSPTLEEAFSSVQSTLSSRQRDLTDLAAMTELNLVIEIEEASLARYEEQQGEALYNVVGSVCEGPPPSNTIAAIALHPTPGAYFVDTFDLWAWIKCNHALFELDPGSLAPLLDERNTAKLKGMGEDVPCYQAMPELLKIYSRLVGPVQLNPACSKGHGCWSECEEGGIML